MMLPIRRLTLKTRGTAALRLLRALYACVLGAEFLLEVGLEWYFRVTPSDRMLAEAVFALLAAEPVPDTGGRVTVFTTAGGSGAEVVAGLPELARGGPERGNDIAD